MQITIVGAGVVGTATGKGFALRGHNVRFVDAAPARVEALRAEGLEAAVSFDLRGPRTLVMLSVPTPATIEGYDLGAIRAATAAVGEQLKAADEAPVVIVRSTVPPGTAEQVVGPILEERSGLRVGDDVLVASNPEFLRAVSALEDFLHPRMTVVGSCSGEALDLLTELYEPFGGELCRFTQLADAEFAKLAHNVFNATKISFFNELWNVATTIGVDAERAAEVVARSAEASWNPDYGIHGGRPFGGACLPKDVAGFIGFAQQIGCPAAMAEAVRTVNELMVGATVAATEDRVLVASGRNGDRTVLDVGDDNLVTSGPWPK